VTDKFVEFTNPRTNPPVWVNTHHVRNAPANRGAHREIPASPREPARGWSMVIAPQHQAEGCMSGAWLAAGLTVGEQWRVGRHSPTRCAVLFRAWLSPEDHGDPSWALSVC
jgi:hypothetical protein